MHPRSPIAALLSLSVAAASAPAAQPTRETVAPAGLVIRVATWNVEDVRTIDILTDDQPRLGAIAETIQRLRPNILLLNEIAYDRPDGPDWLPSDTVPGRNAERFVERYLSVPQAEGLRPIRYHAWMPEVNTGEASGHDLDRSGEAVAEWPRPAAPGPDGSSPEQTPDQRAYGNDAWGFGTYPGQYGMALLVDPRFEILHDRVRTYRLFSWAALPEAESPKAPDGAPWYPPEAWAQFRLASKTLADVPVRLPDGTVVHCVISHPTPPAFDGDERRNRLRNRDEIRLLRAFLDNEPWLTDDHGDPGGLPPGAHAIVLGDLNADPEEGDSEGAPVAGLLSSPVLGPDPEPVSPRERPGLDPGDTAAFGLRVDYVLPSAGLTVLRSGVWPHTDQGTPASDHFPVWAEIIVPDANRP
jgi:endonuclease/exonuclease/phosphatase family metal-dependent hydrolase